MPTNPDPDAPREGAHWNRDDEQKADRPQRTATEPKGSEGSARSAKTLTDPASGEPLNGGHAPNQSQVDQTDGTKTRR